MDRRSCLAALAAVFGVLLTTRQTDVEAGMRVRHARRRVRRHVRRRIRRRVVIRMVFGRRFWVVPVGLAIGWELVHDNRVLIVRETRIVERDATRVEVVVVQESGGKTEEIEVIREDTSGNRKNLEGSVLADDDKSTPGVGAVIEEEVDE